MSYFNPMGQGFGYGMGQGEQHPGGLMGFMARHYPQMGGGLPPMQQFQPMTGGGLPALPSIQPHTGGGLPAMMQPPGLPGGQLARLATGFPPSHFSLDPAGLFGSSASDRGTINGQAIPIGNSAVFDMARANRGAREFADRRY